MENVVELKLVDGCEEGEGRGLKAGEEGEEHRPGGRCHEERRDGIVRDRRVGSYEEILASIPVPIADGRYGLPVAREILAEYWLFVAQTNRRPTRREFAARVPRWRECFRNFRDLEETTGVVYEKTKKGKKRRDGRLARVKWGERCGLPLFGRSMALEPVNEQGVVLLFGEMAKELGFVIERVGTGYPDCIAARKVGGEWKTVRIEFEFVSSRFDHDPKGCDLVVCWEDDWEECPVEVLALAERARRRSAELGARSAERGTCGTGLLGLFRPGAGGRRIERTGGEGR